MSVAQVAQSGPFSRFDGIDRWFAVLKGDGVALLTRGQRHALTSSSAPCYFDGALPVACELLAGSTLDFNLMTRQGSASTNRTVHAGPMASSTFGLCCADWVL